MDFKEKYLKYKIKYLKLKNQKGGSFTEEKKVQLQIDMCASYVMGIIGAMDDALNAIKTHIETIRQHVGNPAFSAPVQAIAAAIFTNFERIKSIKVLEIGEKTAHKKLFMDLFYFSEIDGHGRYILEPLKRDGAKRVSTILTPANLAPVTNSLISLQADDGVHWVYISEDFRIHNPYNYNMQLDHSHQFCQTHSLLMALIPESRRDSTVYTAGVDREISEHEGRKTAYLNILNLLEIILKLVVRYSFEKNKKKNKKRQDCCCN